MSDLAVLAIKVDNADVPKATASLNSLEVQSTKSEAATQRLTRRMALLEIEARRMDAEMGRNRLSLTGLATSFGATEEQAIRLSHALGALSAVAAIGFIGRKTIEETEAAQAAMAQLEAAVASTGGAAGRTVAQLDALSIALQKQTTFSDEAIKGAETMLLAFNKIQGAQLDRATAAVADLAARMGTDLPDAAIKVGKALQDPANGLAQLRRSGIAFSDAQIALVKHLYETGHAAEGMNLILDEMDKKFGGAAAAARDTLGGALAGLKNAWGDLFEVSRGASQGTVTAINAITTALQGSGLSMNKILHDATVDWETMRASIQTVREIMALPINGDFFKRAKEISRGIEFELSTKIAELNKPAPAGPAVKAPPPITIDVDTKQARKNLDDLQKETDAYYNSLNQHQIDAIKAAQNSRVENDQLRELIAATKDGQDAVERVTIAQAGANAVKELGIGVSDKVAAAVRREAEEHARLAIELGHVQDAQADAEREAQRQADEAARDMERRAKELHRTVSSTIEGILTDIDQHRNPFVAIFDNLKRGAIKAISDILASKIEGKIGDFLGIQMPATKQEKAGVLMNTAADKMLRAAGAMNGGVSGDGLVGPESTSSAAKRYAQQFLKVGGSAYGGYQVGYGIGSATQSKTAGAIGGAVSGAVLGAQIAGPVGAAVGGIAGFVGGIVGAGDAARKAAAELARAKDAFDTAFDAAKAEIAHDDLAQAIAQTHAAYEAIRQALGASVSFAEIMSGSWLDTLDKVNAAEKERIAQLEQEAALTRRNERQDIEVQGVQAQAAIAQAQGRTAEADALRKRAEDLAFQHEQERQREAFINSHVMDDSAIGRENQQTYAELLQTQQWQAQAHALQENTKALDALNTTVRNAPTGFKVEPYIQEFAAAQPRPGTVPINVLPQPSGPLTPPGLPAVPPSLMATLARDPMRELALQMDRLSSVPSFTGTASAPAPLALAPLGAAPSAPIASQPVTIRADITVPVQITVDGAGDPAAVAQALTAALTTQLGPALARKLDEVRAAANGPSMTRAQALEWLPTRSSSLRA